MQPASSSNSEPTDLPDRVGEYKRGGFIGQGQFGFVYQGFHQQTEQKVAIKFVDFKKIEREKNAFLREKRLKFMRDEGVLMQLCDSEHIVKCYSVVQLPRYHVIVMEYCDGNNLLNYLSTCENNRVSAAEALDILKQLIAGFAELHRNKIIHRDMKCENVFRHNGTVKIGDLGLSRIIDSFSQEINMTMCGTRETMAPEVFHSRYGIKADIWSLGAILYHLLHGYSPFSHARGRIEIQRRITRGDYKIDVELVGNEQIVNLIERMLTVKQEDRISWSELHIHPLIVGPRLARGPNQTHRFYCSIERDEVHRLADSVLELTDESEKSNTEEERLRAIREQRQVLARQYMSELTFQTKRIELILKNLILPFSENKIDVPVQKYVLTMLLIANRCLLHINKFKAKYQHALTQIYEIPQVEAQYRKFNVNLLMEVTKAKMWLWTKLDSIRSKLINVIRGKTFNCLFQQLSLTKYSLCEQMEYTMENGFLELRALLKSQATLTQPQAKFLKLMNEYPSIAASAYPMDNTYIDITTQQFQA